VNPNPGSPLVAKIKTLAREAISRGTIIPKLLSSRSVIEAIDSLEQSQTERFLPFRLVLVDSEFLASVKWNGESIEREIADWSKGPFFFTSSGLSDKLVESVRRPLFRNMVANNLSTSNRKDNPVDLQNQFHAQHDHRRPHVSVCMERYEAKTVSYSVIEISPKNINLLYRDSAPCKEGNVSRNELVRRPASRTV
jgi:hypothetical protein